MDFRSFRKIIKCLCLLLARVRVTLFWLLTPSLLFSVIYLRRHNFFCLGFSMSESTLKLSRVFHVSLTRFNRWNFFLHTSSIYHLLAIFSRGNISITECRKWLVALLSVRTSADWTLNRAQMQHDEFLENSSPKKPRRNASLGLKFSCGLLGWLL